MKNILIFIGREFCINEAFVEYAKRECLKTLTTIHAIEYLSDRDKNLFLKISSAVEEYQNVLVIASYHSYPTASRVVATLLEDNLIAREDMLVPSKATEIEPNSFLVQHDNSTINVVRAKVGQKLPKILLFSQMESAGLFLFDMQSEDIIQKLIPLAKSYEVELIFTKITHELHQALVYNKKFGDLPMFVQNAKLLLPQNLIVARNLFEYLIERFSALGKQVTFAESCTGGLLASMLTKIPGSSNIFPGSLVTYSNEIKHAWLGVRKETLQAFGAVSEETVEEMLSGALRVSQADYAIAISGIAGPGGATPTKPVGTVVIGAKGKNAEIIRTLHFQGDRNYIQYQAAMYGVKLLFEIAREELF